MIHNILKFCLLVGLSSVSAFYLPGVAPHSFENGEQVELKVNKLRFESSFAEFESLEF